MAKIYPFTVLLAIEGEPNKADLRQISGSIKAAVEHFRGEVGLSDADSGAYVAEVFGVDPPEVSE